MFGVKISRFGVLALLISLMCISGCTSHAKKTEDGSATTQAQAKHMDDPLEPLNRAIFKFNDAVDTWFLKPVAKGYKAITPDPVENSVSRFYSNLGEIKNIVNNGLQWKWSKAGNSTGRFLVNSTVGVVGLFDIAKKAGFEKQDGESFGQTLSVWGVGSGPYLVLPFLGSSTLTDTAGMSVDYFFDPMNYVEDDGTYRGLWALKIIDLRAGLLEAESFISGDKYTFLRNAYLQRREYLVNDGKVEDDFGGDFGDFGEDF